MASTLQAFWRVIVVTIPLAILVLIFQRRIVSDLTAGAVRG